MKLCKRCKRQLVIENPFGFPHCQICANLIYQKCVKNDLCTQCYALEDKSNPHFPLCNSHCEAAILNLSTIQPGNDSEVISFKKTVDNLLSIMSNYPPEILNKITKARDETIEKYKNSKK